ncbi:MAG: tRNA pseudouridine(38-40) synthase TruA [Terriglobia bacterium]
MRNLCLVIAYDGTDFLGWQRQPQAITIQGTLEAAIGKIINEKVKLIGSGRTDAGVHALGQVANFSCLNSIPCASLIKALNAALPPTIRIREAGEAPRTFHSRHSAQAKTYVYRILQSPVALPFISRYVHHYPYRLDLLSMAKAARLLEGEHDFASFAASTDAGDNRANGGAVRTIYSSRIIQRPRSSMLVYRVRGTGFLRYMVRNLVGTLIEVGRGRVQQDDMLRILKARDRRLAGPTAPAQGLCLMNVEYEAGAGLVLARGRPQGSPLPYPAAGPESSIGE